MNESEVTLNLKIKQLLIENNDVILEMDKEEINIKDGGEDFRAIIDTNIEDVLDNFDIDDILQNIEIKKIAEYLSDNDKGMKHLQNILREKKLKRI